MGKKNKKRIRIRLVCLLLCVVLGSGVILYAFLQPTIRKHRLYSRSDHARAILHGEGRRVEFTLPSRARSRVSPRVIRGTLLESRYRLNDKWGWFELYIRVGGDTASVATGLDPNEIGSIRFLDQQ